MRLGLEETVSENLWAFPRLSRLALLDVMGLVRGFVVQIEAEVIHLESYGDG